jgi:signal transduction histidine kinase
MRLGSKKGTKGAKGKKRTSIRLRMLAIVLIPSATLAALGLAGSGYLVYQGYNAQDWAKTLRDTAPGNQFTALVEEERRLSLLRLGGDKTVISELQDLRGELSTFLTQLQSMSAAVSKLKPEVVEQGRAALKKILGQLPQIRRGVDSGQVPPLQVYAYYSGLADLIKFSLGSIANTAPDPTTAVEVSTSSTLFSVAESMSRAHALAIGAVVNGGLSTEEYLEFSRQVGRYHTDIEGAIPLLNPAETKTYQLLAASPEWKQLTEMESALLLRGPRPSTVGQPVGQDVRTLPLSIDKWKNAASKVKDELLDLYTAHHAYAETVAENTGKETYRNSLIGGGIVLLVTLIATFVAARLSNRVVKRMKRLRAQTLEADRRLPAMVERLRNGEQIDINTEVPHLQYGTDELGQVAEAFNKAQRTAVRAAGQEAEIQNGVKTVFLNIAHRSQLVVRRQLEELDNVERDTDDPKQLEALFRLDHLATRARRNAENLLILGGAQAGRQWRNPQRLVDIVRSAISETEQYQRVTTGRLPEVSLVGSVIADLIHLIAELVDNATAYSPPDSRVEVRGNRVGKGVVIEVEDQGLGMSRDEREAINNFLQDPPDFGVMALSEEARLGLFVVSQLAARHGLSVTLVDSAYGGVRAIVLVRAALIGPAESAPGAMSAPTSGPLPGASLPPGGRMAAGNSVFADSGSSGFPGSLPSLRRGSASGAVPVQRNPNAWPNDLDSLGNVLGTPDQSAGSSGDDFGPAGTFTGSNGGQHAAQDPRPQLPRRRRQANLAPQLAGDMDTSEQAAVTDGTGTDAITHAERARSRMSAFQRGTREGRTGP